MLLRPDDVRVLQGLAAVVLGCPGPPPDYPAQWGGLLPPSISLPKPMGTLILWQLLQRSSKSVFPALKLPSGTCTSGLATAVSLSDINNSIYKLCPNYFLTMHCWKSTTDPLSLLCLLLSCLLAQLCLKKAEQSSRCVREEGAKGNCRMQGWADNAMFK